MIQNIKSHMQGGTQVKPAGILMTKSIDLLLSEFAADFTSGTASGTASNTAL